MSSVRNRILQFQENDMNAAKSVAALSSNHKNSNNNSLNSINGIGNGCSNGTNSSSNATLLKSSYARTRSVGSIPPDIVATTTSGNNSNGSGDKTCANGFSLARPERFSKGGPLATNSNISNLTSCINNNNKSFMFGNSNSNNFPKSQQHSSNNNNNNNNLGSYFGSSYGGDGLKTATSSTTTSSSTSLINVRKYSGTISDCSSSVSTISLASSWRSGSVEKKSPAPEPNTATIVRTVEIPLGKSNNGTISPTPPVVNRANKPGSLAMKKASMTINLTSSSSAASSSSSPSPTGNISGNTNGFGNGHRTMNGGSNGSSSRAAGLLSPSRPKARTKTSPSSSTSSIPKLSGGSGSTGFGLGNGTTANFNTPTTVRYRDPSPGGLGRSRGGGLNLTTNNNHSNRGSPATTPTSSGSINNVAFGSTWNGGGGGTGRFYQSIGWKEKFEESEKKRNHLVTLAQRGNKVGNIFVSDYNKCA